MNKKSAITIFGTGALGNALHDFFESEKYPIRSIWNNSGGSLYDKSLKELKPLSYSFPKSNSELGDWIFISTPDDQISIVADKLSTVPADWETKVVVHNSGSLSSDECKSLKQKGAKTVSMHPIQTFRKGDGRDAFRDIYVSLEGDGEAKELLIPVILSMQAKPVHFDPKQKQAVHIAAVFASNYLVALMNSADRLLTEHGVEEGVEILKPLMDNTGNNIFKKGVVESLSGPVSRGDFKTVQSHLELLSAGSVKDDVYRVMGLEALAIAKKAGNMDAEKVKKIEKLLIRQDSK